MIMLSEAGRSCLMR